MNIFLLVHLWSHNDVPSVEIKRIPKFSKPIKELKVPQLIEKINQINSKIKSLSCDDIKFKMWDNGFRFKLHGDLHYEKKDNFRMRINTIFGQELDIGSNKDLFWFWSRRNKTPGLHFAVYEDYYKTRLKTPFNPVWMRSTFGINEIDTKSSKILESKKYYIIAKNGITSTGKEIVNAVFVDKEQERITTIEITDTQGIPLASCEILEVENDLPKKVLFTWYEENKMMQMELKNPSINKKLSSDYWKMPDIKPIVDMGKE